MPTTGEVGARDENLQNRLAELHIAEYNALTSRITYFVTLYYVAWGIAAALFGYLAPLWLKISHRNLEWIGLCCLLAVCWAALHISYELLVVVQYLMEVLLPKMEVDYDVTLDEALGFEGWIRRLGGLEDFHRTIAPNIIFGLGISVLLALLLIDIKHGHFTSSDAWWTVLLGCLSAFVCLKFWRLSVLVKRLHDLSVVEA